MSNNKPDEQHDPGTSDEVETGAITEAMLDRWEAELRAEHGDKWMPALMCADKSWPYLDDFGKIYCDQSTSDASTPDFAAYRSMKHCNLDVSRAAQDPTAGATNSDSLVFALAKPAMHCHQP